MWHCLILLCVLVAGPPVWAQEPDLRFGTTATVPSAILGEARRVNVLLPAGYAQGTERYPVVYLLDGSAHEDYFHAAGLVDFLATYDLMPPSIVVGISNVDRRRDFTMPSADPADLKAAPTSGGAEAFIGFLERELIPHVDASYRTSGARTLIGQSLGGLLATQILLEQPELFTAYVIVDPSLWWNARSLLAGAGEQLARHRAEGRKVYLSSAAGVDEMRRDVSRLAELVRATRSDIDLRYDHLPDESHATSLHISLYRALRWIHQKR